MNYLLPTTVEISGVEYKIRSDYRAILDIMECFVDTELSDEEKAEIALSIFYEDIETLDPLDFGTAIKECMKFINMGEEEETGKKNPKVIDWEQDIQLIISPINRIAGCDIRALDYLHWWTFMSYFQEIGDCLFSQIVAIRYKKAKGQSLEKHEKEFYEHNRSSIDFKRKYTESDNALLESWVKGV